ncbi:MAG: YgiT-type zinc finger protein [Candidatus Stahlbacteria bacterium]|nr:YgiT-type zinc finger protein [Candidatus Stahlbacteria bacterium]
MRCIVCNSPEVRKKEVEEEIQINNDMIFVPINVLVCAECGERYYDRATMRRLENIIKDIKENRIQLNEVGKVLKVSSKYVLSS